MNKKVLIIATSLRKGSNSTIMAEEFAKGAKDVGHEVEVIDLHDKKIEFCKGCLACQKTQKCIINDDMDMILQKMITSDVIAFATPIYFYEMSGQMKVFIDRTNPLFPSEYKFKDIYLLATAADEESSSIDGAVKGLQGWIDCFEKASLKGIIRGTGVVDAREVKNVANILEDTYTMGKNI